MTALTATISGANESKVAVLAQRRCIILALIGSTPSSNTSLSQILENGFMNVLKSWLSEILDGSVGGVDLLLVFLDNTTNLPVTKALVKESGLGVAIGKIGKHSICAGSPNESPIKERIKKLKEVWKETWNKASKATKRESEEANAPPAKKARTEESKTSSLSNLLKTVNPNGTGSTKPLEEDKTGAKKAKPKKPGLRVKWSDHFGGSLSVSKILEGGDINGEEDAQDASGSWQDRSKRDRIKEKELLLEARKKARGSKLMEDDDMGMDMPTAKTIQTTIPWHAPTLLPEIPDAPPPQVNSKEVTTQNTRMASTTAAQYFSEISVPASPAPLSDVEQALDMASQTSAVVQTIPFFIPQQAPAPAPVSAPAPASSYPQTGAAGSTGFSAPTIQPQSSSGLASVEFVQSLGLPMFLVGKNAQALQTLASTPSLLSTFVDSTGMYDQARLTSLVETLTQNIAPSQAPAPAYQTPSSTSLYGQQQSYNASGSGGTYGPASTNQYGQSNSYGSTYGGGQANGAKTGYRGDNNSEGNLHLSQYGPSTTQADIITLFSPYVHVDEVVMKGTFCFVNTSDPVGAQRAREALNGALLGGAPVRINSAQRKNRDSGFQKPATSMYGNTATQAQTTPALPSSMLGTQPVGDLTNVRDDRGNPATKNLFVAGYGGGTSEQQLRELFGQYAQIVGIIMKGTFSFVNTSDRNAAIQAREALSGTMMNGGVLRINFAKETGRLGTSFDLTYSGGAGVGVQNTNPGQQSFSHYGRSY